MKKTILFTGLILGLITSCQKNAVEEEVDLIKSISKTQELEAPLENEQEATEDTTAEDAPVAEATTEETVEEAPAAQETTEETKDE